MWRPEGAELTANSLPPGGPAGVNAQMKLLLLRSSGQKVTLNTAGRAGHIRSHGGGARAFKTQRDEQLYTG